MFKSNLNITDQLNKIEEERKLEKEEANNRNLKLKIGVFNYISKELANHIYNSSYTNIRYYKNSIVKLEGTDPNIYPPTITKVNIYKVLVAYTEWFEEEFNKDPNYSVKINWFVDSDHKIFKKSFIEIICKKKYR